MKCQLSEPLGHPHVSICGKPGAQMEFLSLETGVAPRRKLVAAHLKIDLAMDTLERIQLSSTCRWLLFQKSAS